MRGVAARLDFRRKVGIGFGAAALLVLLVTITSAVALSVALESHRASYRHAEELIDVGFLRAALEHRVASFRGYLLTGEPELLEKLRQARTEVVLNLRRLRKSSSGEEALLLREVERADRGYEEAAAAGIVLRQAGASAEELGRYIESATSQRRAALDRTLARYLAHKRELLQNAEAKAARENLWASAALVASGGAALLLLLGLSIPVTRTLSSLYDTERRARDRAEASEARKTAILESALEGIVTIDAAGLIVEFNPAAEAIFGHSRTAVIGVPMAELMIPPRMREAHFTGFARLLQTGKPRILGRRLEMPALRSDGSEFPVELTITRIQTKPLFFTGFVRDISEVRRVEGERAALLAREREARASAEAAERRSAFLAKASAVLASSLDYPATLARVAELSIPEMGDWCIVDVADAEGRLRPLAIRHVDPAKVEAVTRIANAYPDSPEQPYGPNAVFRTGKAEFAGAVSDEILRSAARDEKHYEMLRDLGFRSYMSVPLSVRGRTIGVLTFASAESDFRYGEDDVVFAQDLAHRASLAIDNARLYREAREAVGARDDFLSIASHELKTPVTTLQLQVQSLLKRAEVESAPGRDSNAVERLAAADRQVGRLTRLINELLDISRITGRGLELELEKVDLADVVRDVVERHGEELSRARCAIALALEPCPHGTWDRQRIEQIVANLLSNAIKYGAGRPIEIGVDGDARSSRLTIRDHGIGIAPENQARIFQRFERAVSKSDYGGFGLGLWIVRQIVDAHGGVIRVTSEPGRGSTFIVELPRIPASAAAAPAREAGGAVY